MQSGWRNLVSRGTMAWEKAPGPARPQQPQMTAGHIVTWSDFHTEAQIQIFSGSAGASRPELSSKC